MIDKKRGSDRGVALWLIARYRSHRPIADVCRFTPSCSEYAFTAFEQFGFWSALVLTLKRLRRCRLPNGGYDPVPRLTGEKHGV